MFFSRRFLPLFITQFLGAMNDNLLKNAIGILITYKLATDNPAHAQLLVTVATGLFVLPYFLFSAMAGQLADKYDRGRVTRAVKLWEIGIMLVATLGFYVQSVPLLLAVVFAMGVHSTMFGPVKYALLPQHLPEKELLSGNAYIEAGTFLAILIGTILAGELVLQHNGTLMISAGLLLVAVVGWLSSLRIPAAPAPVPTLHVGWNIFAQTWDILRHARQNKRVFRCIVGISWFWLVGATYLSQFPTFAKNILNAEAEVVTLFLTVFSVGIGAGSVMCHVLLRGQIQSTYVPLAAVLMAVFGVDFYYASNAMQALASADVLTVEAFVAHTQGVRILWDLFAIATCSGMYIVPLYAIMQHDSDAEVRARVIAANNVMNALYMVVSSVATVALLAAGYSITDIFLTMALFNIIAAIYICSILPDALLRSIARIILRLLYRVEVRGIENYTKAGQRVLLVANHTSFLDAALIAAFLPEKITFAVNTHVAKTWWMKPLLALVDAMPLDPTNPLATKAMIDHLRKNRKCMIFPEGRITVTGALMKVYEGPGMIADKSGAVIVPIRIDGAQYTPFSRLRGKVRLRNFPKITLTILPACNFELPEDVKGRARRALASSQLYDVMSRMIFDTSPCHTSLFSSLLNGMQVYGKDHVIVEDVERKPLTYSQFITRALVLKTMLAPHMIGQARVGVLLPNAVSTSLTFFALQAAGKAPAMLNFTMGAGQLLSACSAATLATVITSQRFVMMGKLQPIIDQLTQSGVKVVYLERLRAQKTLWHTLCGVVASVAPSWFVSKVDPASPAVVLFTSGSEGTPKGVVLSHINIQSNRNQLAARVDFGPQDVVFNCLPMFHSFELTGGTLLPILSGIRAFYYPSPLHYRIVPELVYDTNATIMFGTDTFLSGYARFANAYDFYSLRYVFAGAEKLKDETRRLFQDKYGVRIFEGYGATETSPVLSTNTPMHNRAGTVGRLMPGIQYRLETVPGIEEGGQLFVSGPNVMLGYLRAEKPGELQPLADGWYDTGDVVSVDAQGFVSIKGRTKRFAKIGGEMVSLTTVETAAQQCWPDAAHAAVTVPDAKKGEQIILLTTQPAPARDVLQKHYKQQQLSELALPKAFLPVAAIPLLGTGKTDYVTAKALALEAFGAGE